MTDEQHRIVLDFLLGRAGKDAVVASLGFDIDADPQRVAQLLEDAARSSSATDVELALRIAEDRWGDADVIPTMLELLRAPWHKSHEEIARILQERCDPRAVEALYQAALVEHEYRSYDDTQGLARRCTWALADTGTAEARAKLIRLASGGDALIAGYARKRLDRWDEEIGRKPQAVEDLLARVAELPASGSLELVVREKLTLRGALVPSDVAMAALLDALLAKGFFPDGYVQEDRARRYRYRRG